MAAERNADTGQPVVKPAAQMLREQRGWPCPHDLRTSWRHLQADLAVNTGIISKTTMVVYRFGHALAAGFLPGWITRPLWPLYRFLDLVWSKLQAGTDISHLVCIGSGMRMPHGGRGVTIAPGTVIGDNCVFHPWSGCGTVETRLGRWPIPCPVIEDNVTAGVLSAILGEFTVGRGSIVGAGCIVTGEVPPRTSIPPVTHWSGPGKASPLPERPRAAG